MTSEEIRNRFLEFFKERGHSIVPSASLVPENDPTTLFTSSGMQPLVPYLLSEPHPLGKRIANSQKSFRAEDIDEVGDNRHTTFFEMLGNWSFGDYFKEEQLSWFFEFLTKEVSLKPENLYVTVFAGDEENNVPRDNESVTIWRRLFKEKGIEAKDVELLTEERGGELGMQGGRIFYYNAKKNWWSRSGLPGNMPVGEPGGPDSEVFYDFGIPHDPKFGKKCHPNCDCGRFVEVGNSVFMEYKKKEDGTFEKLKQRNVDFGGGLERITAATNNNPDIFQIDTLKAIINDLEKSASARYGSEKNITTSYRIIADHMRAATFLIAAGIIPSNSGRGYILRRLIRRSVRYADILGISSGSLGLIYTVVAKEYEKSYPEEISEGGQGIIYQEEDKFRETLSRGMKEFEKAASVADGISGVDAFILFTTYGFPFELTLELARERGLRVDEAGFRKEMRKHQELSRTSSAGMFKGGLADHSEQTTRLHTTHHLLLKALQQVLGPHVKQRGSNITSERLRIDFSHDAKMIEEQKQEVERIVNEKIKEDLPVVRNEIARDEAEKLGAEHEFGQKYPERVSIYSIGPKEATVENPRFDKAFSIEFCGGPHVTHTGEIGTFKIIKEEAVAAGVRRIRGIVE